MINVALYFFSTADWSKARLYFGLAREMCSAMRLHQLHLIPPSKRSNSDLIHSVDDERLRRYLWSAWISQCFRSQSGSFSHECAETLLTVPLPSNESLYTRHSISGLLYTVEDNEVFSELARISTIWAEVDRFVQTSSRKPGEERLRILYQLDEKVNVWHKGVPAKYKLETISSFKALSESILANVILINLMYHQCCCSLHSSVVPLICCRTEANPGAISSTARLLSAQLCYEHANEISNILSCTMFHSWDSARVAPFAGFAAYSASAVQCAFYWTTNPDISHKMKTNLPINLKFIQLLSPHWESIRLRVKYLNHSAF